MSHEDKALRNNYGAFDDQSLQQMASMQSPLKFGKGAYGSKHYKSLGRSTARNENSGRRTAIEPGRRQGITTLGRNNNSTSHLDRRMNDLSQLGPYNTYGSSQIAAQDRFLYQQEKLNNSRNRNEAAQLRQAQLNAQHNARIQQLVKKAQQKDTARAKR